MKLLDQKAELYFGFSENMAIDVISNAASHCWGAAPDDKRKHVRRIYDKGHLSVFEHINVSLQLRTDIATYKGLTRHRHCAFTIESTHYKGYDEGLNIIRVPEMSDEDMVNIFSVIEHQHKYALDKYSKMAARNVLPQALAADVTMTTNLREWFHIFDLRKGKENTTNMWKLMELIMAQFRRVYPFFMELYEGKAT
jgi:thymidylate synthase (FAD)